LAVPRVGGQLIKIQVKTSRSVEITEKGIVCRYPRSLQSTQTLAVFQLSSCGLISNGKRLSSAMAVGSLSLQSDYKK